MLLFPFYAVLIWYLTGRYRRSWKGLVVIFVGMSGFATLELLLIWAGLLGVAGMEPWDVVRLLVPFSVLVLAVALFIFFLPYPPPEYIHCRHCAYDLSGLEPPGLRCPECGAPCLPPPRCPYCRRDLRRSGCVEGRCPHCDAALVPGASASRVTLVSAARPPRSAAPPPEPPRSGSTG